MAVWTIADLHLAHAVNKPMNKFGRRWTGHTEKIETRWRALVEDSDTVVIPGSRLSRPESRPTASERTMKAVY